MELPICEYVKTGGGRCGSPAVHDDKYCFFHRRLMYHMPYTELYSELLGEIEAGKMPKMANVAIPFLDDGAAIQIGFMQVVHGLSHGRLNTRQGRLLLSALHGAAANLKVMNEAIAEGAKNLRESKKPAASVVAAVAEKKQAG
jgi:hypothetical protein